MWGLFSLRIDQRFLADGFQISSRLEPIDGLQPPEELCRKSELKSAARTTMRSCRTQRFSQPVPITNTHTSTQTHDE